MSLVKVDAQVCERGSGRLIPGLTAGDFRVLDENQPQPIVYFAREEAPVDLMLLLDISGSMRDVLERVTGTAETALRQLHETDRVAAAVFATRSSVVQEFTSNFAALPAWLRYAIQDRGTGVETAINRALHSTAEYVRLNARHSRRAILIITDNEPTNFGPPTSDETVLRALYEADAVLNGIIVTAHPGLVNFLKLHHGIYRFAAKTGGEVIEAARPGEQLARMIERIRTRYSIQYNMPPAPHGLFRRIRVELSADARRQHPRATVRARTGYYASRAGANPIPER